MHSSLSTRQRIASHSSSCTSRVLPLPEDRRPSFSLRLGVQSDCESEKHYSQVGWHKPARLRELFVTQESLSSTRFLSFPFWPWTACKGRCHPFVIFQFLTKWLFLICCWLTCGDLQGLQKQGPQKGKRKLCMCVCGTEHPTPRYEFEKMENSCLCKMCMLFILDKRKSPEAQWLSTGKQNVVEKCKGILFSHEKGNII